MASFKAEVYKHQVRRDGTYSIKIRIIHNRKKKYIDTDLVVTRNDITKGFKLKNYFFIDETEKIIKKYRGIEELGIIKIPLSPFSVVKLSIRT